MASTNIARRIRRSMVGMTLGLSVVFAGLALLLLYITEDLLFVHQLREERDHLMSVPPHERGAWTPRNRKMSIYWSISQLPETVKTEVGEADGIYEEFDGDSALFVLRGSVVDPAATFLIVYDVTDLLVVRQSRSLYLRIFLMSLAVVIIIALALAIRLSRKTLQPLRRLTVRLREGDELPDGFSEEFRGDEVGVLAETLETSLARLRSSTQREFEFNRGVSHELRTPIQVAKNALEIIEGPSDPKCAASQRAFARLRRAVAEMEDVAAAFLWMATGRTVDGEQACAKEVAEAVASIHQQLLVDRVIRVSIDPEDLAFPVPKPVLAIILGNLVRNAAQHSTTGPIECTLSSGSITVSNAADSDAETATQGFGVGLEIVRRICDHVGWELDLTEHRNQIHARVRLPQT